VHLLVFEGAQQHVGRCRGVATARGNYPAFGLIVVFEEERRN
jgi:hypothetical protein